MRVKPSLVVNSSPLIALVAALPDFDVLGPAACTELCHSALSSWPKGNF